MTLPVVLAHHGSILISIAFGGPVLLVGIGIGTLVLRDRREQRREERAGR